MGHLTYDEWVANGDAGMCELCEQLMNDEIKVLGCCIGEGSKANLIPQWAFSDGKVHAQVNIRWKTFDTRIKLCDTRLFTHKDGAPKVQGRRLANEPIEVAYESVPDTCDVCGEHRIRETIHKVAPKDDLNPLRSATWMQVNFSCYKCEGIKI